MMKSESTRVSKPISQKSTSCACYAVADPKGDVLNCWVISSCIRKMV